MKPDYKAIQTRLEASLRKGEKSQVRAELRKLLSSKPPRDGLLTLSRLARRAGAPELGVRLLNPLVRASRRYPARPSPSEIAEYAACLIRIGASEEALLLLEGVSPDEVPECLLFRSFALVAAWEYAATIPILQTYLKNRSLSDYERLVGNSNLAAALVAEGITDEAEKILSLLVEQTSSDALALLHGNALELQARNALTRSDWSGAEEILARVEKMVSDESDSTRFFARKWRAVLDLKRFGLNARTKASLTAMRSEALARAHWETVRECDRYLAVALQDRKLFDRLFFGTAHAEYRRKLVDDFGGTIEISPEYLWVVHEGAEPPVLDLFEARFRNTPLKPSQVVHRLFSTLSSDFYRPFRLASVHYRLYPDDYYNPVSAPGRVHRALQRLRQWCRLARAPLQVIEEGGMYRLTASRAAAVRIVHRETPVSDAAGLLLARLRERFRQEEFSAQSVVKYLHSSTSAVNRILQHAQQEGVLERLGRGPRTRYKFAA